MRIALGCKNCKSVLVTEQEIKLGYCQRHSTQEIANWLAFGLINGTHRAEGHLPLAKFQVRQFQQTEMTGESNRFYWLIERGRLVWGRK